MSASDTNCDRETQGNGDIFAKSYWPPVYPTGNHTVLYNVPIVQSNQPPVPRRSAPRWDSDHVRMPCSNMSQYPLKKSDGTSDVVSRWDLIRTALQPPIKSSRELETAILSYNNKYARSWSFRGLHSLFDKGDEEDSETFFTVMLPKIMDLALKLPQLIPGGIPLLKQGRNHSISLSQEQVACLVANAFLCTFPRRNTLKWESEYGNYPDINFNRLFASTEARCLEKIKCICHYFKRIFSKMPTGVITFSRRFVDPRLMPRWDLADAPFEAVKVDVRTDGTIEDNGKGLLQVDFANKFVGGGVLGSGCVQEEIRFVICPELLISRLFTEALDKTEALHVIGAEQFSEYSGYAGSFTWKGNHIDDTPRDECGRRKCHIVAIDALHFAEEAQQYQAKLMLRELNKAYVGFLPSERDKPFAAVASGNWGCGAFNGDSKLKSLLQIMVCTLTKRDLVYFTFGDCVLKSDIDEMFGFLVERKLTVQDIYRCLCEFSRKKMAGYSLYDYIYRKFRDPAIPQSSRSPRNVSGTDPEDQTPSLVDCLDEYFARENPSKTKPPPVVVNILAPPKNQPKIVDFFKKL
ncbi:poly(ADP-ribose) glycohydrolase [Phlebotomus argentipes]|uniref:poly(ADP-ribose) glycohydrolase n=1 Tax=Phlebotomus argentipes TaxID=94469 RepID=UPI002892E6E3|nr:poly(ADP-ribose) glycohydrolase [Phlebotomus argentipes]